MSAADPETGLPAGDPHGTGQQPGIATLVFSDGSTYTGTLRNGTPHGLGTCVWKDGNQYDGEWRNGVMHGFGTYLWTSGQRYDGEWKDGKREGVGVKKYVDGSTFHGIWREGKKHGVGVFKPPAKDKEKERARNPVRVGSGRLASTLSDGDSVANLVAYEAAQQAAEEAFGPQVRAASETSVAPGPAAAVAVPASPSERDEPASPDRERGREAAREREKERDKEKEKEGKLVIIRVFEDGKMIREGKLTSEDAKMIFGQQPQPPDEKERGRGRKARRKVKRALGFGKKLQQKHGQLLYKGMPGYNLMLRLQHGIRWSVGRGTYGPGEQGLSPPQAAANSFGGGVGPLPLSHELGPSDFTQKVKVFFPAAGSPITPAHPAGDFKWKDYSPRVFRNLRNMYGIADADYMLSLGGSSALWQLNSPGKSGCMFFLSDDERFLVKTMRKTEIRTLIDMLPEYYRYMESNPQNLVIRFFGVHGVKQVHGRTVRFVVMHNMFNTDLQIHKKFDLKGSTEGRTTGPKVDPNDPKTVFKDLDLDLKFLLEPATHAALMNQINSDAAFLRKVEVMDYSLLLGIHFCNRARLAQEADGAAALQQQPSEQGGPPAAAQNGHSGSSGGAAPTTRQQPQWSADSQYSMDGDESHGQRSSPGHVGFSPGGPTLTRTPGGAGAGGAGAAADDAEGEHVRNFDLFSNRTDMDRQLRLFEERMRGMGYGEERIQDILSLARLRILGDRLKKRSKKAYKVFDGPGVVLSTLASRRHEAEVLPRLDEAEEGPSDEEDEAAQPAPKQPQCLGYQMRALAVHTRGDQPPEEVVLCFGIIDILQDWNVRKVFERTLKSITHDSQAISVAPPKLYSVRFADFLTHSMFLDPESVTAKGLRLPPLSGSGFSPGVQTVIEEEPS